MTHNTEQNSNRYILHTNKDPPVTITSGGGLVTDLVRKFEGGGPRKEIFRFGDNSSLESPNKRLRRSCTSSNPPGTSPAGTGPPGPNIWPGTPPPTPRTIPCTASHRRTPTRQGSRPRRTMTRRPDTPNSSRRSCSDTPVILTTTNVPVMHPSQTVSDPKSRLNRWPKVEDGGHLLGLLHQHQGGHHLPFEDPGANQQPHNTPGVKELIRNIDKNNSTVTFNDNKKKEEEMKARNIAVDKEEKKGINIQKFPRLEEERKNISEEEKNVYLQVPGPGAEASSSQKSSGSLSSMESGASLVIVKSSNVPESSGAGNLGTTTSSSLIFDGTISEPNCVVFACSCSLPPHAVHTAVVQFWQEIQIIQI